MNRIIEIQNDGYYLSAARGFMVIEKKGETNARKIPLTDIGVLQSFQELAAGFPPILSCALLRRERVSFFAARIITLPPSFSPVEGHHEQTGRIRQQIGANLPLRKRLWQTIVQARFAIRRLKYCPGGQDAMKV